MEKLKKVLTEEVAELERIQKAAEGDLKAAPQGTLRIARNKETDQYYWRTDCKDTEGKYIRKGEEKLIKALAQKDYAKKVLSILEPTLKKEKKELQRLQKSSAQEKILQVYEKLSPARQKLVNPYIYPEEKFVIQWELKNKQEKEKREKYEKHENSSEIYTEKGECVRSKSEKILADKLYMMNIPYSYEKPLYLQGYGYIKPDFTVLNKRLRKEYYWEHLGMMDDKEYCEKAIRKIESYEKNGIFSGENLILTYETKEHPLNMRLVEMLIKEYLL